MGLLETWYIAMRGRSQGEDEDMAGISPENSIGVIIIASLESAFESSLACMLNSHGIPSTLCDDLYSGLAEVIENRAVDKKLVIASHKTLCKEKMKFLQICDDRADTTCCCIINERSKPDPQTVVKLLALNVIMATDVRGVEKIAEMIATEHDVRTEKLSDEIIKIEKDEFALTDAELESLLG